MKRYLVGNWKMNLTKEEARSLASSLAEASSGINSTHLWVAPPYTSLGTVGDALQGCNVIIGAQNVHWEDKGAFTGEISVSMLEEARCSFAIVGHSERRHVLGETDQIVAKRTRGALEKGFGTILCVGETEEERDQGKTEAVVKEQLEIALQELSNTEKLIVAYEPVWAIGTGRTPSLEEIDSIMNFVREETKRLTGRDNVPLLYGGSVSPDNYTEIVVIENVNGALVGGASLKADKFIELLRISESVQ